MRGETRLDLVVIGEGFVATHRLPAAGTISIGRGTDVDLRIDDESVSRRHALLHVDGGLFIEDLGSANGTRVGGTRANGKRIAFEVGELVELGTVMLVAQRRATAVRVRRVWSHDAFEARVEEECTRASPHSSFAVLRVRVTGLAPQVIQDAVLEQLRPQDVVAWYGPTDLEILALETASQDADDLLQQVRRALVARGGNVHAAFASYPRDGASPDVLIGRACDRLRGPREAAAIVCDSRAMQDLHRMVHRVAVGTFNIVLHGEMGAGKEVIADRLHQQSPRAAKPILKLNCAAFSDALLESELFGHEREAVDGGTVFLDEIGELPLPLQAKLLRVIEERAIDVRFIAATHHDLEAAIAAQTFRRDLFHRLDGITLVIPPLRERRAEIVPLAVGFAAQSSHALGRALPQLTAAAIEVLEHYAWPGNVRELRNVMERAVLLAAGDPITPEHLGPRLLESNLPRPRKK